jgi:hypothetical protein
MSVPVVFFGVTSMGHPGNYITTQPLEMIKSDRIKKRGGSFFVNMPFGAKSGAK